MKLENPFPEYGYFGPEYFCDREQETEELINALVNGSNVTLMAPRRIGKTGLISHAFERMKAKTKMCAVSMWTSSRQRPLTRWYSS